MAGINPAVEEFGVCVVLTEDQIPSYAKTNSIDLVFVGPEVPLVNGLVDELQKEGVRAFGPSKLAAQLEGSKVFSKMMMRKYNIPTAKYESFNDYEQAREYLSEQKAPIVLKADGLAAGKGVIIANTLEEAQAELKEMMCNAKFNKAGSSVVIEEFLQGEEFSLMCFVSNRKVYPMEIAQDHKRAFDNDEGLNTGGMGAYLPLKKITQDDIDEGVRNVVQPMVDAMSDEGMPFYGILYAGLMKCHDGVKTIEFNVRFGDPESEILLLSLESDLYEIANNIIDGKEVNLSDVKYFLLDDYNTDMTPYEVHQGDILIAMSGATTGKIGFYNYEHPSYLNQRVGKFLPNANILNNRYLYHFLLFQVLLILLNFHQYKALPPF